MLRLEVKSIQPFRVGLVLRFAPGLSSWTGLSCWTWLMKMLHQLVEREACAAGEFRVGLQLSEGS